jgi:hypothetical protein
VKHSRFSEEQIIGILKQSEAGVKTSELCRQQGTSTATRAHRTQRGKRSLVCARHNPVDVRRAKSLCMQ